MSPGLEYRLLFENMTLGFALYELHRDGDGAPADWRILEVNDAYTRHTGLARSRVLGRLVGSLFPKAIASYLPRFVRVVDSQVPETFETYARSVRRHQSVAVIPAGGDRFATIIIDVTDRKRAEAGKERALEELARSHRDLEQFAYASSHDLQEPLRTVSGLATLLQERLGDRLDAGSRELIRLAVGETDRMRRLVDSLAEYSRAGRTAATAGPVSSRTALDAALVMLGAKIAASGASVVAGDLPVVRADPEELSFVFRHLVGNAIKFRRAVTPALVRVACRTDGGLRVFSVADNGIGVAPEQFERIFLVFQKLHGREHSEGTGIGLPIVRRIVEAHGGRTWVRSCVGEGSTFFFTLPAPGSPALVG
jgi:light-regulated signal transduction histidine kinase (bacteriophytochrome)